MKNSVLDILANTKDIVWAVDAEQRIVLWNAAAEKHLGYTDVDALGKPCYHLLQGKMGPGGEFCRKNCDVFRRLKQVCAPLEAKNMAVQHADGREVTLNASTITPPFELQSNSLFSALHICRPVSLTEPNSQHLFIHFLGPMKVVRSDGSIVNGSLWQRLKVRALFALLALEKAKPVYREKITETLWPHLSYSSALQNLNSTVYRLRRSLEPALKRGSDSKFVVYENGCYALNDASSVWLDIEAAEKALHRARHASESQHAIYWYEIGLSFFRGRYLADLINTNVWNVAEEIRWHELHLSALEELALLYVQAGNYQKAEALLRGILTYDSLRETVYRHLMQISLKRGNRATAVDLYQRLVRLLKTELNTVPSPQTAAIFKEARTSHVL